MLRNLERHCITHFAPLLLAVLSSAWLCGTAWAQTETPRALRVAFSVAESGFDPQAISDDYSWRICQAIFDPLLRYDYLARPAKLVPNTANGLPLISDGGRTYTVKVRPGIYFAPHAAFGNAKRELVAEDYVFSIKRILDPKVRSYWLYLFEKRLVGLDEPLARARKPGGSFDYDATLEGLRALDRYTLQVRFKDPDWAFQHWLATVPFAAVAREVVDARRDSSHRVMEDPIGTGPYRLAEWRRGQRIVLEANPNYREVRYPSASPGSADADVVAGLTGRKLPLTPRVEVSIIEEAQSRILAFRRGEIDYVDVPPAIAQTILSGANLASDLAAEGVRLYRQISPSINFTFFNLDDPAVGGYTQERIALRRAISMALDRRAQVRILANGQAELANQPVPPPVPGHNPSLPTPDAYDPLAARALLDRFGYVDRDGDGFRERPDGKPLIITKGAVPTTSDRAAIELWKKNMDAIGIRTAFLLQKWPELNRMSEAGQLPMWNLAWIASIPDGDLFYAPLYSRNIGLSNDARFRLPEYDRTYEAARALPDGPQRFQLYRRMNDLIAAYTPWILESYAYDNVLAQPWLRGFKQHPFVRDDWAYYEVGAR